MDVLCASLLMRKEEVFSRCSHPVTNRGSTFNRTKLTSLRGHLERKPLQIETVVVVGVTSKSKGPQDA